MSPLTDEQVEKALKATPKIALIKGAQSLCTVQTFFLLTIPCGAAAGAVEDHFLDREEKALSLLIDIVLAAGGTVAGALSRSLAITNRFAARGAGQLSKQAQKGIRSLEKQIAKHEQKLADFKANPTVRPGMEKLPKEVIQKQQQTRIQHLETEIQTFKDNIEKIRRGDL